MAEQDGRAWLRAADWPPGYPAVALDERYHERLRRLGDGAGQRALGEAVAGDGRSEGTVSLPRREG